MSSHLARTVAAAAVAALVLYGAAACSDSDTAGSDTVNIGAVGIYSGPGAPSTTIDQVAEAWEKSVNAAGGINGKKVNLIVKDVGTNPGEAMTAVRSLINDDDVVAILDHDFNDISWVKLAESSGVPVISASGGFGLFASPNVFPIFGSTATIAYAVPAAAKELGDELALGYASEVAALSQQIDLFTGYSGALDLEIPVSLKMSSSQPDYTAFCQQVKESGADSYFLAFVPAVAQNISQQCNQQGVDIPQVLSAALGDDSWKKDPAYEGAVVVDLYAPFFDTSIPGIQEYNDALKEYAPDLAGVWNGATGNLSMWATAQMFAAAASQGEGDITAESVTEALRAMQGETLDGIIPPVDFTGEDPQATTCTYVWTIKDEELTAPDGLEPTCAPRSEIEPVEDMLTESLG